MVAPSSDLSCVVRGYRFSFPPCLTRFMLMRHYSIVHLGPNFRNPAFARSLSCPISYFSAVFELARTCSTRSHQAIGPHIPVSTTTTQELNC